MKSEGPGRETARRVILVILFLAGAALRLLLLGKYPPGLNQDEASEGYETWALLVSGMDRNGNPWPVIFPSWGSGQNVLYAYLSLPFVALFGLTPGTFRLTAALWGTLTLPAVWGLGRRLWGEKGGAVCLALAALCPWHIMLSRWALEANLLPCFLLLGIWLAAESLRRPWLLLGSAAAFGLSLYAYGPAFLFLACFLPPALVCLLCRKKIPWYVFSASAGLFLLLAAPVTAANLRSALGLDAVRVLGLTLPKLTETRQASTMTLTGDVRVLWGNWKAFWEMLFKQTDGLAYNAVPGRMFAPGTLLFAAFGLGEILWRLFRGRLREGEELILWAVFAVLVSALFIVPNLNRMNMAFLPVLILAGRGGARLWELLPKRWMRAAAVSAGAAAILLGTFLFAGKYLTETRDTLSGWFYEGLGEAIEFTDSMEVPEKRVTDTVNMPYIYVLFYTRTPPEEFRATVRWRDPGAAFQHAGAFGEWTFSSSPPPPGAVWICYAWEAGEAEVDARFDSFVVCRP